MKIAALTFVYNERVNLPIWLRYYGQQFGIKNLFVIDRESDDGSTENLADANRFVVPRDAFDDAKKVNCMSSFQNGLLSYYDAVVCGDCDELVVPNPALYANLADYVAKMEGDYATCIGVDVLHVINQEPPLDLTKPIMSQRRFGRFRSAGCKTLLSRIPIRWAPGLHCMNKMPRFDLNLFNFHLKTMDYQTAMMRQEINQNTSWSSDSLARNHGAHHRYDLERFAQEAFLEPVNVANQKKMMPFDFSREIAEMTADIVERDEIFFFAKKVSRWVEIPDAFRGVF